MIGFVSVSWDKSRQVRQVRFKTSLHKMLGNQRQDLFMTVSSLAWPLCAGGKKEEMEGKLFFLEMCFGCNKLIFFSFNWTEEEIDHSLSVWSRGEDDVDDDVDVDVDVGNDDNDVVDADDSE